jgi:predicted enzyme related to lactoylglutathione lyase
MARTLAARRPSEEEQTMSHADRYIPGVPCWVDTTQPDPGVAVAFYGGLFGWELEDTMPAGSPGSYHVARLGGRDVAAVSSQPEGGASAAVWNTYVWVADADATADEVRTAGGEVLSEPLDVGDAGRMAVFADPAGAAFCVWEARGHRGAEAVNEHGALNFNDLRTRDLDRARSFYGAVFGWEVLDLGGSFAWALPGYGDFLERRTPGTRENMAQMGAPERFEDVVASLAAIGDDQPDAVSRWGVTFGVDEADAVASRAVDLGGEVLVPPFDAPWVRTTVIADPAGATFTATQFVPENKGSAGASAAA